MFRSHEPWHFNILDVVIVVMICGKRLTDAARGVGRSLRIFKSEMKEMKDEGHPAQTKAPEPLEGRVVDGDGRASTPTEQRRDA